MTLVGAAILNVIIGLSGLVVGLTMVAAVPGVAASSDMLVGVEIVFAIPIYGLAAQVRETLAALGVAPSSSASASPTESIPA